MTQNDSDLKHVKRLGLSLIQLMTLVALLGLTLTAVLYYFFPSL